MTSSTRHVAGRLPKSDPQEDLTEDGYGSREELLSEFAVILGYLGLLILGVLACIVAAVL